MIAISELPATRSFNHLSNNMETPVISICIPTRHRAELLRRTLLSIDNSKANIEVIVSDNSENELSAKIVKECLSNFKGPWKYHRNIPVIGPVDNANKAIELSTGQYIFVLHDDDYLYPDAIDHILKSVEQYPQYTVLGFGVKVVNINGKILKVQCPRNFEYLTPDKAILNLMGNSSYIRMPSIVIKKDAYMEIGFWNPLKMPPDDIDMFARMLSRYGLMRVPKIISAYTIHKDSWTEGMYNSETIQVLQSIFYEVSQKHLIDDEQLLQAKTNFFHQFILGGTYRFIKRREFKEAKKIMSLFELDEINSLPLSKKWHLVRKIFGWVLLPF
ncbi:MAG TPA: glycosyltransferase [Anaerolineaceae bacterium]|nr:glycosyltransferase [Anaerolineaceae bacterium]